LNLKWFTTAALSEGVGLKAVQFTIRPSICIAHMAHNHPIRQGFDPLGGCQCLLYWTKLVCRAKLVCHMQQAPLRSHRSKPRVRAHTLPHELGNTPVHMSLPITERSQSADLKIAFACRGRAVGRGTASRTGVLGPESLCCKASMHARG
jgi:hypothetical protein